MKKGIHFTQEIFIFNKLLLDVKYYALKSSNQNSPVRLQTY